MAGAKTKRAPSVLISTEATHRTQESLAKSHPSLRRTSSRWIGRTKGMPFSRMILKRVVHLDGQPALMVLKHPTRKTSHVKHATKALLAVFFPSIPEKIAEAMLGGN